MRRSWWCGVIILLLSSCAYLPGMFGQESAPDLAPPQAMRLCVKDDCKNLTWVGDRYESHKDGETAISARYWITTWEKDNVEFIGKTATAADGVYPLEATFTGKIAPGGSSIAAGSFDWRVGPSNSGSGHYTLTWKAGPSNAIKVGDVGQFAAPRRSKTNPNVLLPAGASEEYAAYPADVRALLQPDHALTPEDAKRPCRAAVIDPDTTLEIARYAYRAADIARGNCWTLISGELGNLRAKVLLAVGWEMGWQGKKDDARAFGILKMIQGQRDPFGMYFLEQCYINGTGTPKDLHESTQIDFWMMTSRQGQDVFGMIGADDAEVVREYRRLQVLMNPPESTSTSCELVPGAGNPPRVVKRCTDSSKIDQKALQGRLDTVEQNYSNSVKQKQ